MRTLQLTFAALSFVCLASIATAAPVNSNLLTNPSAADGLNGWSFHNFNETWGNGWAVSAESQDGDGTSFIGGWWTLQYFTQSIDLQAIGFTAAELDAAPAVDFMGWTKSTQWAADHARAVYQLKDELGQVLSQSDTGLLSNVPYDWTPLAWQTTLPVGTRQITVTYAGYDGEGWGGYYGMEFDAASVTIAPEPTSLGALGLATIGLVARRRKNAAPRSRRA